MKLLLMDFVVLIIRDSVACMMVMVVVIQLIVLLKHYI